MGHSKKKKSESKQEGKTNSKKKSLILIAIVSVLAVAIAAVSLSPDQNPDADYLVKGNSTYFVYAEQIVQTCKEDIRCSIDELNDLDEKVTKRGTTLDIFLDVVRLYDKSDYKCHETSHHLGMWLYGHTTNLDEATQYVEMLCGGGLFHGVFQNYFMTQKSNNITPDEIDVVGLCSKYEDDSINRWQCIHGIGHGLINVYDYDVFAAVSRCEELKPGLDQISCSKGTFMQNVVHYYETGKGDFNEDIYYPCDKVESKLAYACYHYHSSYILKQKQGVLKEIFEACDNIPREEMVKYCYYGLGRQLSAEARNDVDRAIFLCQEGLKVEYHTECLRGMMMTVVNRSTDPTIGFIFCKNLPEQYKANCYDGLGQWIIMLESTDSARLSECIKAESDEYMNICMDATLENIKHL